MVLHGHFLAGSRAEAHLGPGGQWKKEAEGWDSAAKGAHQSKQAGKFLHGMLPGKGEDF
jgi:hypothetical protein